MRTMVSERALASRSRQKGQGAYTIQGTIQGLETFNLEKQITEIRMFVVPDTRCVVL